MCALTDTDILRRVREAAGKARQLLARFRRSNFLLHPIADQLFPALPECLQLDDLQLDRRTRNALRRAQITSVDVLTRQSWRRLAFVRGLGTRSFRRLLEAVERLPSTLRRKFRWQRSLHLGMRELNALWKSAGVDDIAATDARLGRLVRQLAPKLQRLGQLRDPDATRLFPINPTALSELLKTISRLQEETVETEYLQIVMSYCRRGRNEPMVRAHCGLGRPAESLAAVARRLDRSRERVRQVCDRRWLRRRPPYAPVMMAVLKELSQNAWRMAAAVQQKLVDAGRLEPGQC